MFQMFGFGGVQCPRCESKNAGDSGYCARCGLTLGAPRREPVLRENRWIPAPDELAVFFGVRALSGLFVKTLRVPATTRAYILQGDKATEVPQGEYEIEGFFARLNNLLRDQHAEILITRSAALPVEFSFDGLRTAEHLAVSASFRVSVRIEQVPAFAQHFMTAPGTVTTAHLRELLAPPVRQLAAEFMASRSLREMAANRDLRLQLDERLQSALKMRLAQFGLAVVQVDTLDVHHEKYDANRERVGSLWMVADERHVQLEHEKHLDQLYTDEEWQRIKREEQDARIDFRRAEMREDQGIEKAELQLQNAERMHAIRARDIDLYGRVVESKNRKQAIERGAADVLAGLEHELAKKGGLRADEAAQWEQLRQVAGIRMHTELEAARRDAGNAFVLAQQRFSHQLVRQQIQNRIEQALAIEDESRKRTELARLHQAQAEANEYDRALDREQHRASLQSLELANAARRREAERVQEWEDQQAFERRRELARGGEKAEAVAQHDKLIRTIEADGMHMRQELEMQLDAEERRQALVRQEHEARWQHELRRIGSFDAVSDTAKLALAPTDNAAILGDYMKTQVHASMSAGQLESLAGMSPLDAARMADDRVQQDRVRRDAEVEKDRRHQVSLLAMHSGAGAARTCPNGHAVAPNDRFCARCGAAIQH
ncbi:MAG: SPFH domain-containing protein [Telluria sp.]